MRDYLPPEPEPGAVPPRIEMYEQRGNNPQITLVNLGEEFLQHDRRALIALTPEQRRAQIEARGHLHDHVLRYWEQAKANGWDPAVREEWATVAGMVDYAHALESNAQAIADELGDS